MKKLLTLIILLFGFVFANNVTPLNSSNNSLNTDLVSSAPRKCIDLNSANFDELQGITHVGIDEAISIIKFRNVVDFRFEDDLSYVNGISVAELGEIKAEGLACVSANL